jgi:aminocarboxymuconate-semialdehyde decarboxylase
LPSLKAFARNGRILFGTDFPFAPAEVVKSFTAKLDAHEGLMADEQRGISHGNAWTLFPRFTQQNTPTRTATVPKSGVSAIS